MYSERTWELTLVGTTKKDQRRVLEYAPCRRMTLAELAKTQRCRDAWFKLKTEQDKSDASKTSSKQEQVKEESVKTAVKDTKVCNESYLHDLHLCLPFCQKKKRRRVKAKKEKAESDLEESEYDPVSTPTFPVQGIS